MSSSAIALSLPPYYRRYDLPWTRVREESQRLRKIFLGVAGVSLFLSLAMPLLPSEPVSHSLQPDMPPRLAKLMIERKAPPPAPPPVIAPPEPVAEQPPAPKPTPEPEPVPKIKPPAAPPKLAFVPQPKVTPEPPVNQARERAAQAGLVAMADELAELRDSSNIDSALSSRTLATTVGAATRSERALVTSTSGRASGGINTAALSRDTGGQGLAGRSVTQVVSPVAGGGGTGASGTPAGDPGGSGDASAQRNRAQIEMIFDRNKAAIYALYRRALRQDPSLQGKLVLELTISASGQVTDCRVVSSELNAPEFEAKLVQRVRLFKFGPQNVDSITTTKPIDFFPV